MRIETLSSLIAAHFDGNATWFRNLVVAETAKNAALKTRVQRYLDRPQLTMLPHKAQQFLEPLTAPKELWLTDALRSEIDAMVAEHRAADRLRERGLQPRSRILFYGPPGCGKTAMARLLAARLERAAFRVNATQIVESTMGSTGQNLSACLQALQQPVVLVVDEIDSLAMTRISGDGAAARENSRIVNTLLTVLDSAFEGILIMTTNRIDDLDPAFRRRLDTEVFVGEPDEVARSGARALYCRRYGIPEDAIDINCMNNFDAIEKACAAEARADVLREFS